MNSIDANEECAKKYPGCTVETILPVALIELQLPIIIIDSFHEKHGVCAFIAFSHSRETPIV